MFSSASVVRCHVSEDVASNSALGSSDRCEPQREPDFEVSGYDRRADHSGLLVEITWAPDAS